MSKARASLARKFSYSIATSFLLVGVFAGQVSAATFVPGGFEAVEGNSNNNFPFKPTSGQMRYQQFYNASAFTGPLSITGIAFRLDEFVSGPQTFSYTDLSISMSTALANTTTFADNIGADVVNVFNQVFNETIVGDGQPVQDFDLVFNFSTAFNYDPTNGDLLLDVFQTTSGPGTIQLDASSNSPAFSRLYNLNANSLTGIASSTGLVTQFIYDTAPPTAVPLPAALPLLAGGLGVFGLIGWRRKRENV